MRYKKCAMAHKCKVTQVCNGTAGCPRIQIHRTEKGGILCKISLISDAIRDEFHFSTGSQFFTSLVKKYVHLIARHIGYLYHFVPIS